jgi:hypothetical protein
VSLHGGLFVAASRTDRSIAEFGGPIRSSCRAEPLSCPRRRRIT